ncbi:ribonuclease R [Clostridium pasteurianum DSM 525 = ATCC 6013]|uniref:Ribonuclease R n=1 Tax=Clostridium pasteurianum DSM 525 = ATCC 6013 TaxID=1262449 RepID=A0A0H3J4P6_CLOPA|nr:ribonuclease R [Clostridium pasteurianum]AJA48881.1 ribonuclease R [Clostridium pasteurianum DSM 525 = ATCC 6013]AJA52869.1 ribonuclease R [Clostridium pasteurianum DSM 525 = ATCC 6013]AOZ76091.1 ribonuclease R [Clostridium pasteurianum DSM 525 = ATCC 6013]AOZ79887.1 ribonuclease R [Clostridium pasteurianum]ELP60177.1 ribonuclease R [Clostridium pasteurianum DSM 525 = ATCC 6013]
MNLRESIVAFMREQAYKPMNILELSRIFDIKRLESKNFKKLLKDMEQEGLIVKNRTKHYGVPERMGLVVGKLQGNAKGFGFVICEWERPDIFIASSFMNGAMNGDKVVAKITREENGGKKCEGEIIRILERANKTIIGVYEDSKNFGFVVPDDVRIHQDVFIPKSVKGNAKTGDVVIAEIIEWPEKRRNPEGKIIEVLGKKEDKGVDILTIIKKHKLPEEFPDKVLNFADKIPDTIPEEEYKNRRDLRDIKMVTIDGEDAKDLDDAVSIEKLENGNYYLGVHIADVSNYVREKNPLDKEALLRGTSVYLIDRVIPMLPRKLSNGICSLNPKVDRLALSCFMEINEEGKVVNHDVFESIIKTNERMTYTDVTKIMRDKDKETIEKYKYLYEDFMAMEELCNILYKRRINRGSIDFDFQESKIILNEQGKPIDIKPYERAIANRVIEEFMLVCNETIAEHMFWTNLPFVYRIHEDPDTEKLEHFNEFAHNLGYVVRWGTNKVHPKELQKIIEAVKGKKEETVVSTLLLRSLKQARYSPECVGHFGLAAKYYCHFTSPIRRYPDLMIHRIIKEFLHGKIDKERSKKLIGIVDYASVQSSDMERVAQEAEREVDDLKKAEYMQGKIGEEYDGIISSVTNFGMFVELPNTIEGLVHISYLNDDYYIYDEKHLSLIGERTKKIYRLGDEVRIKVQKVNLASHEIYFEIAENDNELKENKLSEENSIDNENLDSEDYIEEIHPPRALKDTLEAYKPEISEDEE